MKSVCLYEHNQVKTKSPVKFQTIRKSYFSATNDHCSRNHNKESRDEHLPSTIQRYFICKDADIGSVSLVCTLLPTWDVFM